LVLGPIAEQSLHKALALWGPAFLLRPISLILVAIIVGTLGLTLYRRRNGAPSHVG
jgi:TctA family transporter